MINENNIKNNNKKIVNGCFYSFFINGMLALTIGSIMPSILEYYKIGYNQGGMILAIQSIGNLLISFLIGIISVHFGRKNTIVLLSSMTFFGLTGILFFESRLMLLMLFFLTGIGRGSVSNISNTIINDVSKGSSATLNVLHTFFAIGAFMAPFISSWLFGMGFGWKYSVGLVSILSLFMVFIFMQMNIDNNKHEFKKREKKEISYKFMKSVDFYISCGILFFYVSVEYSLNGWIVTYFKDTGMMSTSLAQKMLSILWIVIIFGRLFTAFISQRIDKDDILLASSVGTMIFFGLLLLSLNINMIIICIFGLGFCLSGIYPTAISNINYLKENSELIIGTILGVAGLGGIIIPYVTGVVADNMGISGGMLIVATSTISLFIFTLANKFRKLSLIKIEEI